MKDSQFRIIYQALLNISKQPAFFDEEKLLVKLTQEALESMDAKVMYGRLLEIGLRQGRHNVEQEIIRIAQDALRTLFQDADTLSNKE